MKSILKTGTFLAVVLATGAAGISVMKEDVADFQVPDGVVAQL